MTLTLHDAACSKILSKRVWDGSNAQLAYSILLFRMNTSEDG
jgi:hypothetical protein